MISNSLMPSPEQVRARRESHSIGLFDARRTLLRENVKAALDDLNTDELSPGEARLLGILQAMFDGGLL